jgi:phenylalanyl-tRNA synthetase beta chain
MKLSPQWIREFVDVPVDDRPLASDLTDVGVAVEGISGEGANLVYEMEITTNRPDEMNHHGVAREASAIYDIPLKRLHLHLRETPPEPESDGIGFEIEIQDAEGCARYTARIVRGIKLTSPPPDVAARLNLVEQRSINSAADASNYTLWEMGHPTHAFDLDLLEGGKIIVRRAVAGETLKTLDGIDRKLSPEDLIIADVSKPVALAGVIGGFDTMITENTRNVLVESAWFDPVTVRKSAKRHLLHTDASHRFERGADWGATPIACAMVAQRIADWGGAESVSEEIDEVAREITRPPIPLRFTEVQRLLSGEIGVTDIERILTKLGFQLSPEESGFTVEVPTWRLDVEREIDLIEEIARVYGYNKFANTLPAYSGAVVDTPDAARDAKLRSTLLALGYNEAVSLSFISGDDATRFSSAQTLELENPLSSEASFMRTSLVPSMLDMLAFNLNRGTDNVRLFEAGKSHLAEKDDRNERKRICLAVTGSAATPSVSQPSHPLTFFDLKGDMQELLEAFDVPQFCYHQNAGDYYHPGRSARIIAEGETIGLVGQLHPQVAAERKLKQEVFLGELFLDKLYKYGLREVRYKALPRYPAVERDFSFLFADAVTFEIIEQSVRSLAIAELRSFVPVEIFRGGVVPSGKYSILLRATLQSNDRTLTDAETSQWSARIVQALEALGGTLRAS